MSGSRWRVLLIVAGLAIGALALKAAQDGWFSARPPLEVDGQPALIFFTLDRGCPCQMQVVDRAEAQLASWGAPSTLGVEVIHVDFNQRRELAESYGVARAPALVLLDSEGEVVWKQDLGLSDESPLDLSQAQWQMEALVADAARQ